MKNLNKKKRMITCSVLLFSLLSITIFTNFNFESLFYKDDANKDDFTNFPKTSDSLPSFKGTGNKVNITLHQSILNTSTISFSNLDNENTFQEPAPKFQGYNTSNINIDVDDINAPNKTILYEDQTSARIIDAVNSHYISFKARGVGYIENISIYLNRTAPLLTRLIVSLYNSELDGSIPKPLNLVYALPIVDLSVITGDSPHWHNMTNIGSLFNCSETYNDTFYLNIEEIGSGVDIEIYGELTSMGGDGSNDNYVLDSGENEFNIAGSLVDAAVEIDFVPLNNTPKPSQIGLEINNKSVNDVNFQKGKYIMTEGILKDLSGTIDFNVSADWWDVACNVSRVQINYTKTDLRADSSFEVLGNGQDVLWNVTKPGGLNYFDSRFNNYTINFTISSRWENIEVWNGGTNKTDDIKPNPLNNYKDIQVFNAGNGTHWFLNATSSNLLEDIKKYVGTMSAADNFNYTDLVRFNGTFSSSISDGSINLSVYSPLILNDHLNYTFINSSFISGDDIYFGDWDISEKVTKYGKFRILTQWNNGTDAGFFRDNITIFAETNLLIDQPSQNTTFNSSTIFNVTIIYNDTGQSLDISDGDIYYKINAGTYSSVNESVKYIGSGKYNITFDCNNTEFNYGLNTISIRANNTYYHNQTDTLYFFILGETSLIRSFPKTYNFDSGETFNVTLYFNDTVKNIGIDGADAVDIYVNDSDYTPLDFFDYGNGYYNLTVNCSDSIFNDYGSFDVKVDVNKTNYYNQTTSFVISITGETSLDVSVMPVRKFYYSTEIFNITAYFNDTARNQGINGATIDIDVDGSVYSPLSWFDYGNGYYNISVDCSDPIFSNYGSFQMRINATKLNYYKSVDSSFELIIGNTTLTRLSPPLNSPYVYGDSFNITIYYRDVVKDSGITGATIEYSIDGSSYKTDNIDPNGNGNYNITINVDDTDFGSIFGFRTIIINASKTNYNNVSIDYVFHRQINTTIEPDNFKNLGSVERGLNVSFRFNYSDGTGKPITQADWSIVNNSDGFVAHLENLGEGNYTMHLNTSFVTVSGSFQLFEFNISSIGNETQIITLQVDIQIIHTQLQDVAWNSLIARNSGLNQTVNFYFNDTTNNQPILDLTTLNVDVKDFDTGLLWDTGDFNWNLNNPLNDGNYELDVSTNNLNSGWYTLQIEVSKFPNYNTSIIYTQFYLRGNYTSFNINSISDLGGEGLLTPVGNNYSAFIERNIYVAFNLTDNEFNNELITGDANSYVITYYEISNATNQGTTTHTLTFDANTDSYNGYLTTSSLTVGTYAVNITVIKTNYENSVFSFNLTVKPRFNVRISVVDPPTTVTAGDSFFITLEAEYYNGTDWLPLIGTNIILTPYFNGISSTPITIATNGTGIAIFEITIRNDAINMTLLVEIQVSYNHLADTLQISDISIIPLTPGFTFEELLPYIIIIGAVVALAGGSLAVYRGVVVPKKREKQRILTEVKTIFDDAINLEHILVLYKGTGTCIFFKSYGSEQIDPELIGGFLSAVSSFGKEMKTQEALNEISYGDKMLLLADGEYIRVALVLGKKASLILRRHLKDFINTFGKMFKDDLPNWRGQLNPFRNAGLIVDEILNTSIILPHQISDDFSSVKELKNPHARDVLKVAHSCCEETDRSFVFIATLLKETSERTNKDTAEIFIGIKELRDRKILIPIEISAIEAQPVSQQEINLINQKVTSLTNLSNEEKQNLVNFLAELDAIEREAYLSSLTKQHEIVSAPIKTTIGTIIVDNKKSAIKGVKELSKRAKIAKGKKNYRKTIELYQSAAMLASNWELSSEFVQIEELIRKTKIEDLSVKKKDLEKEAKDAVISKNYAEASAKYKHASKIASEIFKLGASDMTKEVKRLTKKANEYEKLK